MSKVVNGTRGFGHLRTVVNLTLGCVLLGGCSSGSDRFTSDSFGTGYGVAPRTSQSAAASPKFASSTQQQAQIRPASTLAQPVAYQPQTESGYQLASANAQSGGYMQASRVDLPPLPQREPSQRTKLADGYGPGNMPPLADGTYTGPRATAPYDRPRASEPYDGPRSDVPPMGVYTPEGGGDASRYGRSDAPPPSSNFYRRSEAPSRPAYEPREETRVYEPKPSRNHSDGRRYEDGERSAYNRDPEAGQSAPRRPWSGRTDGEMVEVARGDTVYTLARRYGVTVDMIARANGLSTVYVRPGTKLFVPRADPASFAQSPAQGQAPAHAQSKKGQAPAAAAAAKDESRPRAAPAEKHAAPAAKTDGNAGAAVEEPKPSVQGAARLGDRIGPQSALKTPVPVQPAPAPAPVPDVRTAGPVPMGEASCEAALSNPQPRMGSTFRTPVDGKTIAPFGAQKDGTVNEGITISVPKGTPVKAAENGVVAYVGDELPGFGNLILIRHADEYVTAYAHADTVLVRKCDHIKRGQTIATAGTTGDASQPQVHFEIRKNSKPVDPSPLLGS
jgi:murein DD-endopeptidase MepM/ murein hydrolase activator NlpD